MLLSCNLRNQKLPYQIPILIWNFCLKFCGQWKFDMNFYALFSIIWYPLTIWMSDTTTAAVWVTTMTHLRGYIALQHQDIGNNTLSKICLHSCDVSYCWGLMVKRLWVLCYIFCPMLSKWIKNQEKRTSEVLMQYSEISCLCK